MCMYSSEDIKRAIEYANDVLKPVFLFCNPKYFNEVQREFKDSIFEVVSSPLVEENKLLIMNKADCKFPHLENIPKIDLEELKIFINNGGEE